MDLIPKITLGPQPISTTNQPVDTTLQLKPLKTFSSPISSYPSLAVPSVPSQAPTNIIGDTTNNYLTKRKETADLFSIPKKGKSKDISTNNILDNNNIQFNNINPKSNLNLSDFEKFKWAIAQQESGQRYNALGLVVSSGMYKGDRPYGKYQVMGKNVPSWTKAALGKALTPQQFLNSPEAQEAVFDHKMRETVKKYGSYADAASVWFSGQPLKNNNAKDDTGTSVPKYVNNILNMMRQNNGRSDGKGGPGPGGMANQYPELSSMMQKNGFNTPGNITTPFGGQTKWEGSHTGVDIANREGTPVKSQSVGTVTQVVNGYKQANPNNPRDPNHGYGNRVVITDPYGNQHRYSHLKGSWVQVGQKVPQNKTIGTMGKSGSAYSPSGGDASHLDYAIRSAAGRYVDPNVFLSLKR